MLAVFSGYQYSYFACTSVPPSPLNQPQPPVQIHIHSTTCEVISFNGQGQLCHLTCAG